jgi:hypothetical protein
MLYNGADASIPIHYLETVSKSIYFSWGDQPLTIFYLLAVVDDAVKNIDAEMVCGILAFSFCHYELIPLQELILH